MMASRIRVGVLSAFVAFGLAVVSPLASARAQDLQVSTQPALYPAFDPSISDYVTRCTAGTPEEVSISAPVDTAITVDNQGSRTGDFTAQVNLAAGESFGIVATSGGTDVGYHVRCLPADFPAWTFERSGQPQAEWYTAAPFARTDFQPIPPGVSNAYVAIFDDNGVPVWWMKNSQLSLDFLVLANGHLAWNFQDNEEHRLDGSLVRTIKALAGADTDPHELLLLPNGNYLLTVARSLPGFSACGQSNLTILDGGIQEVTPDGSLVYSWWASDHIPLSEVPSAWCDTIINQVQNGVYDVYHVNSIDPDGDGYVISFRHLDAIYRIDRATGDVVWKLGGVPRAESLAVLDDPNPATDLFRGQHDARVLSDGTVTVHDNGYHSASQRTPRAVRYAIDLGTRTATLVEQKNDPGTFSDPALCCGSARKLPGGDWVIAWGSAGGITELSPTGARVFKLTFDDKLFTYRTQPVPFGTLSRSALRDGMDAQFPHGGYARPGGARTTRVPLVPAYGQCVSPDRTHGGPLAFGSCSSPATTSSFLTVGTSDANGAGSNSTGSVAYKVKTGNPSTPENEADVRVRVGLTDVRLKSDLSDYAGQLQVRGAVRITDRLNGPLQNEAATGFDTEFPLTVPCTPTPSETVGATCSLSSSVNAIVPGTVVEGKRANWELGKVQVFDGGSSGIAGAPDATLFEAEGLFVP
jgi:hypothetical protein